MTETLILDKENKGFFFMFFNNSEKELEPDGNVFQTTRIWALDLSKLANHLVRLQIDRQKSGKSYFF
jgi:hypothetical protein